MLSDIRVPRLLYNLIFGESVLNDPIAIVMFAVFKSVAREEDINAGTVWLVTWRFSVICIGSILTALVVSLGCSFVLYRSQ